jgi:signal transduction histidine kinase
MPTPPRDENSRKPRPKPFTSTRGIRLLLVLMVIVGYVVNFIFISAQDGRRLTPAELFWGISFGVIYLLLGLKADVIFDRLPGGWAEAGFFSVQCALLFGIGLLLETRGTWLIGVPLVGFAVEQLARGQRWAVYVALCASLVLPLGLRHGSWAGTLLSSVTVGTAILFVALFAQMRLNEQQARERAEQLTAELEQANAQLAAYATQAEELAMTQERNRLAREIHDNLGHTLTTVNVQLEAARVVMESDPGRALDALTKAQDLVQKGLTGVRESVAALRESPVRNRSLGEAIASLVQETQSSGIITEFEVTGEPQALEHKVALALYRAAQEGLTNVRRHARASRVDVRLDFQPGEVRLQVRDNGVGATDTEGGFGLLGIRERMQLLGGRLEISTGAVKGFCLTASVPMSDAEGPLPPKE